MHSEIRSIASAVFLLAASAATPAMAVGLVANTSAFAPDPLGDSNVSDRDSSRILGGSAHASSEAAGFGALAVAEATAEFGVNRAFARASSPDLDLVFPPQAAAFASSLWVDEITIGSAAAGGFVSVEFQFHAVTIQSSYSYASSVLDYEVQLLDLATGNQVTQYRVSMDGRGNVSSFLPVYTDGFELVGDNDGDVLRIVGVRIPFISHRAFGIASTLGCQTRAPYNDANRQTCDANGTSVWRGITGVTDMDGRALTDWTATSASGTDYTRSFVPPITAGVPEPATWALLIAGFALVGGGLRLRLRASTRARQGAA